MGTRVAAATVSLGFGGYLHTFVDVDPTVLALAALVAATFIAFYGLREAVWLAGVLTRAEAGGLVFVIVIGVPHLGDVDLLKAEMGAAGIFSGAALVMFAFIGFEQIATLAGEPRH